MKKSSLLYRLITTFTTIIAIILVLFSIILTLKYKSEIYSIKKSKMETTSDIIEEDIINLNILLFFMFLFPKMITIDI